MYFERIIGKEACKLSHFLSCISLSVAPLPKQLHCGNINALPMNRTAKPLAHSDRLDSPLTPAAVVVALNLKWATLHISLHLSCSRGVRGSGLAYAASVTSTRPRTGNAGVSQPTSKR